MIHKLFLGLVVLASTLSPVLGQVSFYGPTVDFGAGTVPYRVVLVDMDGDGDLDIVCINRTSGSVHVYRNAGSGSYSLLRARASQGSPFALATADLNADGLVDVLVANQTTTGSSTSPISVYFGIGGGDIGPQNTTTIQVPTNSMPRDLKIADLDGDGDRDVVILLQATNQVALRVNNGTGSFANPGLILGTTISNPFSLLARDLDDDGDADIAVTGNSAAGDIRIFRNNGGSVVNTNMFPASLQSTLSPPLVSNIQGIAVGNFNSDSLIDLAIIEAPSSSFGYVTLLRGTGNAAFALAASYYLPGQLSTVTVADLDGNGRGEVMVPSQSGDVISVLEVDGAASFTRVSTIGTKQNPVHVAVGDIDGDGDKDMVVVTTGLNRVMAFDYKSGAISAQPYWVNGLPAQIPVHLSFGPAYAGKSYQAYFGVSGSVPPTVLTNGSVIPIATDFIATWLLAFPINPIILNPAGTLDSQGGATVTVDMSAIGFPSLNVIGSVAATVTNSSPRVTSNAIDVAFF